MEQLSLLQMQGHLMWHSLTPKMIHVNQRWMVVTDDKKVELTLLLRATHTHTHTHTTGDVCGVPGGCNRQCGLCRGRW